MLCYRRQTSSKKALLKKKSRDGFRSVNDQRGRVSAALLIFSSRQSRLYSKSYLPVICKASFSLLFLIHSINFSLPFAIDVALILGSTLCRVILLVALLPNASNIIF